MKNINLKMAIFESVFTQKQIAIKAGIAEPELSKAINHGLRFDEKAENRLARVLGKTREEIFTV